ncbi:hypothetical protein STVIR_7174 [Streptomyces viridochromogenes Tue57]|uniref:Uncharacterized protein n=1 Tax=Streptomyces viridochromogenes Tue57 TaxID=1160705 RepID=L8P5V8_STRVR|nr:hypothetical protein STVIR_7174 [Streptomyces viridochromogenes Tue57]
MVVAHGAGTPAALARGFEYNAATAPTVPVLTARTAPVRTR